MQSERMKHLIKNPSDATEMEVKSLAYLLDSTTDILMLRNQQIRLLKTRLEDALKRSLAAQRRATNYSRWITFLAGWAVVATLGLLAELFT